MSKYPAIKPKMLTGEESIIDKNGRPGIHRNDVLELVNEMGGDRNDFYYVMEQAMRIFCCDEEMPERKLS